MRGVPPGPTILWKWDSFLKEMRLFVTSLSKTPKSFYFVVIFFILCPWSLKEGKCRKAGERIQSVSIGDKIPPLFWLKSLFLKGILEKMGSKSEKSFCWCWLPSPGFMRHYFPDKLCFPPALTPLAETRYIPAMPVAGGNLEVRTYPYFYIWGNKNRGGQVQGTGDRPTITQSGGRLG